MTRDNEKPMTDDNSGDEPKYIRLEQIETERETSLAFKVRLQDLYNDINGVSPHEQMMGRLREAAEQYKEMGGKPFEINPEAIDERDADGTLIPDDAPRFKDYDTRDE